MARIRPLKYHEDNVTKRSLTYDDLTFLKELQKELNTQDTVGEADPRYWVLRGTENIYHVDEIFADGFVLGYDTEIVAKTFSEALAILERNFNYLFWTDKDEYGLEVIRYSIPGDKSEEIHTLSYMDQIVELLKTVDESFELVGYEERRETYSSTMFLTHKAAVDHLNRNDYHYAKDAHTYAETSPDPNMEKLISLLHEVDFDEVEKAIEQYKDPAAFCEEYRVKKASEDFVKEYIQDCIKDELEYEGIIGTVIEEVIENVPEDAYLNAALAYMNAADDFPKDDDEVDCLQDAWDLFNDIYFSKKIDIEKLREKSSLDSSEGFGDDDDDEYYTPSATARDYSPSNPWDAPGMSIRDFI